MENKKEDSEEDIIEEKILLIACYEKPYSRAALKMIRGTIKKEKPSKIIILKIIKEPKMKELIDTRIGKKAKENFIDSVVKDKKEKVEDYTADILKITDETDIPTEVRTRKTEVIADKIVGDYEKMKIDNIIIHDGDRGLLDRLIKGEVESKVKNNVDESKVIALR